MIFSFHVSTVLELSCWYLDLTSDMCVFCLGLFISQFLHPLYWPQVTIKYDSLAEEAFPFFLLSSHVGTISLFFFLSTIPVPGLLGMFLIFIPVIYKPVPETHSAHRATR